MPKGARARRYASYRYQVDKLTRPHRTRARYGHTLDHIVPVSFGFKHDIPPSLIASAENVAFVPFQDNIQKGTRLTDESRDLLRAWGYAHLAAR